MQLVFTHSRSSQFIQCNSTHLQWSNVGHFDFLHGFRMYSFRFHNNIQSNHATSDFVIDTNVTSRKNAGIYVSLYTPHGDLMFGLMNLCVCCCTKLCRSRVKRQFPIEFWFEVANKRRERVCVTAKFSIGVFKPKFYGKMTFFAKGTQFGTATRI